MALALRAPFCRRAFAPCVCAALAVAAVVLAPTAEAKRHKVLVATHLEIPVPPPGSGTITGKLGIRNCFTGIFSDDKRIKCPRPAVVACTANVSIRATTSEGPAFGGPLDYFSTTAADGSFSLTVPHYPGDGTEVPVRASPAAHHNTKRLRIECQPTVNFAELS